MRFIAVILLLGSLGVGCTSNRSYPKFSASSRVPPSQIAYGEPVDGLAVGLSYEGRGKDGERLRVHLKNVGARPVELFPPASYQFDEPTFDYRIDGEHDENLWPPGLDRDSYRCTFLALNASQFRPLAPVKRQLSTRGSNRD